ncbi:hypothetical protein IWZ01DRAFT_485787 [Phyllosticta capitalensis]
MSSTSPDDGPPTKVRKESAAMTDVHGNALGKVSNKKEGLLMALPLELFRMILKETIDPSNAMSLLRLLTKRSVSKFFNKEIILTIIMNRGEACSSWMSSMFVPQSLRVAFFQMMVMNQTPNEPQVIETIRHAVSQIQGLQNDWSEENRYKWLEAACSCIIDAGGFLELLHCLKPIVYSSEDVQLKDIRQCCWILAAWENDVSLLKSLHSSGTKCSRKSSPGRYPCVMGNAQWAAAARGHCDVIRYLLAKKFEFREASRGDALEAAMGGEHVPAFKLILQNLDGERRRHDIARDIAEFGRIKWAKIFWSPDLRFSQIEPNDALMYMCAYGTGRKEQAEMARILIKAGAVPDDSHNYCFDEGDTPIENTIRKGKTVLLRALIEDGAWKRAREVCPWDGGVVQWIDPVLIAIEYNKPDALEVLLEDRPWETRTCKNALAEAVRASKTESPPGNTHMLAILLRDFDPNRTISSVRKGRRAVELAREQGKNDMLDMLLEHGCGVELKKRPLRKCKRT